MNTITQFIISTLLISLLLTSCSSDDGGSDQDPIIGSWEGEVFQPDFGTSSIDLTITSLVEDQVVGSLFSMTIDLSSCDTAIYLCESASCSTTWTYKGRNGSSYLFLETVPAGSDCADGNITARLTGDNEMTFSFVGIDYPDITSTSTVMRK